MKVSVLLFDADGTILDFYRAERQALKETLDICSYSGDFEHALKLYSEINIILWKSFEAGEINQNELRTKRFAMLMDELNTSDSSAGLQFTPEKLSEIYLKALAKGGFLIEDAMEVLTEIRSAGKFAIALVTNGLKDVQYDRLKIAGIHDFFDKIIISEEIGVQKPENEFFEKTFRLMENERKEEYLIIGDTYSSDIQGGINAGIKTCWYNPEKKQLNGREKPDFEIEDLKELLSILAQTG